MKILVFLAQLLLISCNSDPVNINLNQYNPKINIKQISQSVNANLNGQSTGVFEALYIGEIRNEISVTKNYKKDKNYDWRTKDLKNLSKLKIQIQIDTTKIIYQENHSIDLDPSYDDASITNQIKYYNAYPVYIINIGTEDLAIGLGDIIPLTKEAKDSLGDWRTIETAISHTCGTGLTVLNIEPNELVLTTSKIYLGSYKTKIRLNYYGNYSNEIEEYINYNQFESDF